MAKPANKKVNNKSPAQVTRFLNATQGTTATNFGQDVSKVAHALHRDLMTEGTRAKNAQAAKETSRGNPTPPTSAGAAHRMSDTPPDKARRKTR